MAAAAATSQVPRCQLAPGLDISRIVTGLWQVADLEREGGLGLDQRAAAEHLRAYAAAGLSSFDMADHYGSAEELIGELVALLGDDTVQTFTKWCPKPGPEMATREAVDEAVRLSAGRMGLLPDHAVGGGGGGGGGIPLLQFHTWDYLDGPGSWLTQLRYLAAHPLVRNLGLTNFDTQHLRVALAEGLPIVSNQVSFSLLDTRAAAPGGMGELCTQRGVAILAFGVLAGGLLTDRWLGTRLGCFRLCTLTEVCLWRGEEWREFLSPQDKAGAADAGQPEPTPAQLASSWSLAKYMRFVDCFGGWGLLQELLQALRSVADRHTGGDGGGRAVSIANVAVRWVLEHPAVGAAIVGARLGHSENITENLGAFGWSLDAADVALIAGVLARATPIHGDCGDEYRRPPFLTAQGDLSDHLEEVPLAYVPRPLPGHTPAFPQLAVDSGTSWEGLAGFSRAVRRGSLVAVSGTTATERTTGKVIGGDDAGAQTVFALDVVEAALKALGATLSDVVRTRLYVARMVDWEAVARAHGARFGGGAGGHHRPANTLVQAQLVGEEYLVEVEAEAIIAPAATTAAPSVGAARL